MGSLNGVALTLENTSELNALMEALDIAINVATIAPGDGGREFRMIADQIRRKLRMIQAKVYENE